jgi:hypothetical protein
MLPVPRADRGWLVSGAFDLTWFFGGAALSVLVLGLYFVAGAPIVALWWIWLLAFDGPHIGAAFTRTYLDRDEWRRRPGLLLGSLLTFAVGPVFLAATALTGSPAPFLLFLGFATFYGYYHVVRQHYGFVALYNAVNHDTSPASVALDKRTLYVGCWAPYAYFLLTHPQARALLGLTGPPGLATTTAAYALLAGWLGILGWFAARHLIDDGFRLRNPKTPYLAGTVILYGWIYFAIARFEPVYGASEGPDQDFLLLSIVIVIFHNLQYLGLVWFHNRNRYAGSDAAHGLASVVNRAPARFLAACGLFSLGIYATFACGTGVFPACQWFAGAAIAGVTWNQVGLCLWWGLAMNHYYLDQKIWRIRGDATLKRSLRLA